MDLSVARRGDSDSDSSVPDPGSGSPEVSSGFPDRVQADSASDCGLVESTSNNGVSSTRVFSPAETNTQNSVSNKRPREDDLSVNGLRSDPPPASRRRLGGALTPLTNGLTGLTNGFNPSDDEGIDLPLSPMRELNAEELASKMKLVHQLQAELRNEEMKLVLIKKLRQSQMMKENVVVPPCPTDAKAALAQLPSNTTATKLPASTQAIGAFKQDLGAKASASAIPAHFKASREYKQAVKQAKVEVASRDASKASKDNRDRGSTSQPCSTKPVTTISAISSTPKSSGGSATVTSSLNLPAKLSLPFNISRDVEIIRKDCPPPPVPSSGSQGGFESQVYIEKVRPTEKAASYFQSPSPSPVSYGRKSSSSTPTPTSTASDGGSNTPAQHYIAARLALRKKLEKTLLRNPPPKPSPPSMPFIPNPSNPEFIHLLGLEQCVEYILNNAVSDPKPVPCICSLCGTDFTPSWKLVHNKKSKGEKAEKRKRKEEEEKAASELCVICEQCVTAKAKAALKAEQTARLKAAFVKTLHEEQEIAARFSRAQTMPSPQPEVMLSTSVSASPVSTSASMAASRLPASVSVTAVKSDYGSHGVSHSGSHVSHGTHSGSHGSHGSHSGSHAHSGSHGSQHRSSSVAAQLQLQRERERRKEQEKREKEEREREERERRERERREREREKERERERDMYLPPGLSKAQKEQFLQSMAAMAAMTNPAALQQLSAAQAQLMRMQQGIVAAAAGTQSQIPQAMLAPYLMNPYNPFGMQLQQLMALGALSAQPPAATASNTKNLMQQQQQQQQELLNLQRQYLFDMIQPGMSGHGSQGNQGGQGGHSKWGKS